MFDPKVGRMLSLISQLGISMVVPILMMGWIGNWIDSELSTQLFFPISLILGIAGGFRSAYALLKPIFRDEKEMEEEYKT